MCLIAIRSHSRVSEINRNKKSYLVQWVATEVPGQILDYAKQLSRWTFVDLQRKAAEASKKGPEHLLRRMRGVVRGLNEAAFVDRIERSLKVGDFL